MFGLALTTPAQASEDVPWRLPLRAGLRVAYECTGADQSGSALTRIEVQGNVEGGIAVAFSFGDDTASVDVVVDSFGRPVRLLDPEAAVRSWREFETAKLDRSMAAGAQPEQAVAPDVEEARLGLVRAIQYAVTPEDFAANVLARAGVFLPPAIESRDGDDLGIRAPIEHPIYAGGGIGAGHMAVARHWPLGRTATMKLLAPAGEFSELTLRMVAAANGPDADLRTAWLFLGFVEVRESRIVSVPAGRSWASEIRREIERVSPFGSASETRSCVRRR